MCSLYTPIYVKHFWVLQDRRGRVLTRDSGSPYKFCDNNEAMRFANAFMVVNVGEEGDRAND